MTYENYLEWKCQRYSQWINRLHEDRFKEYWFSPNTTKFVTEIKDTEGLYNPNLLKHIAGEAFKKQHYKYVLFKYWKYTTIYGRLALEVWDLELEIKAIRRESFEALVERAKGCYRKLIRFNNPMNP